MSNSQPHEAGGWWGDGGHRAPARHACMAHCGTVLDASSAWKMSTPAVGATSPVNQPMRFFVDESLMLATLVASEPGVTAAKKWTGDQSQYCPVRPLILSQA